MSAVTPEMDKNLQKAIIGIFQRKDSAFYGSLMSAMSVVFDESIETACVVPKKISFGIDFFNSMTQANRLTVIAHELRHLAYLHPIRKKDRNHELWNKACDYKINLDLRDEGYDFGNVSHLYDEQYRGMTEEEIYDKLQQEQSPQPNPMPDMGESNDQAATEYETLQAVSKAVAAAKASGSCPAHIAGMLEASLTPQMDYKTVLEKYCTEMIKSGRSYRTRNRRYPKMILPGKWKDQGKLDNMHYYFDVSGSVTDEMAKDVVGTLQGIQEHFKPEYITLVQFDTRIQSVKVYEQHEPIDEIEIVGRGGTCFSDVIDHIEEHQPSVAVIFTDLYANTPREPDCDTKILWVIVNSDLTAPYGDSVKVTV